jgi:hypothetical protein
MGEASHTVAGDTQPTSKPPPAPRRSSPRNSPARRSPFGREASPPRNVDAPSGDAWGGSAGSSGASTGVNVKP